MSAPEIYNMHRSEKRPFAVDFGENTAGATTGPLPPGDTIASATVAVESKPTDAAEPTIGTVTVISTTEYINLRECSSGEAVTFPVTLASTQAYGQYAFKVTATTTAGYILIDSVRVVCQPHA